MSAGKGDKPRKVKGDKYRKNYDRIFKKNKEFKSNRVRNANQN